MMIETPVNLSNQQKELLINLGKSFEKNTGDCHTPKYKNFFNSVKKFLEDLVS